MPPPAVLCYALQAVEIDFTPPFRRISMVSGLEEALNVKLPADLDSEEARLFLVELVSQLCWSAACKLDVTSSKHIALVWWWVSPVELAVEGSLGRCLALWPLTSLPAYTGVPFVQGDAQSIAHS